MEHLTHFFLGLVDHMGFPGLFLVMFLGSVGLPVGTELAMPIAGSLSASGHLPSWPLVGLVGTVAELIGCGVLYSVGFAGGRPFVVRWGKFFKLSESKLDQFHGFYSKYGNVTVLVCRFLPLVRGFSSLPAGVSRMQKRYFFTYTAIGSGAFCFGLAYVGYLFGPHIKDLLPMLHKFSLVIIGLIVLAAIGFVAYRMTRKPVKGGA